MSEKASNPKDAIGDDKIPFHLWPETATIAGAMAFLDGALKYGRSNYRPVGAKASTYYNAARRHLNAWFEGEDLDPDSGLPHLGHVLACIAILVDVAAAKKLNDDRQYPGGYRALLKYMTPHVKRLKALHADKTPKHYDATVAPETIWRPAPCTVASVTTGVPPPERPVNPVWELSADDLRDAVKNVAVPEPRGWFPLAGLGAYPPGRPVVHAYCTRFACPRKHEAKGLCKMHYKRARKYEREQHARS